MNMQSTISRLRSAVANGTVLHAARSTLVAAFVGTVALGILSVANAAEPERVDVDVAPVLVKHIRQWDSFNGRISAIESVDLRPRVSGYIDDISYREGDEVHRGDILFTIDPRPYQAILDSAKARLERARASVILAKLRDQRAQRLLPSNAVSQDEADTRHATYEQSQADVLDAEAAVATAKLNLEFTQIRAPIDGRTGRAIVTVGNLAVADQTLLTTMVSLDPIYVDFDPDEQTYLRYSLHAKQNHQGLNSLPVRVGLANEEGYPHSGVVYFVDNLVNSATGTIRLRAKLSNADRKLTPGLFARVELANAHEIQALLIDDKAVLTDQDRKYVYVLGSNNTAQRKDVKLGRTAEGLRIVESGLSPEDKIIINGLQRIYSSGAPVNPSEIPTVATAKIGAQL
jgi:multidrug efflux system membrane fusion protein